MLAFHGVEVPFTHDLAGLGGTVRSRRATLPPSLGEIDRLTPFGVRLRYGDLDEAVPVARGVSLGWAEQAVVWARAVLDGTI